MPIIENEESREIHLQNQYISYIITIMKNNQLGHLYFGSRLNHNDSFQHLFREQGRATMSCVFEGDLSFSLDIVRQEYPSYGTSDYREPAFQIQHHDGSRVTDFEYDSHYLIDGKPLLDGLPATHTGDDGEVTTLCILLKDKVTNLKLELLYSLFEDRAVITRSVKFLNEGDYPVRLKRALSCSLDFFDSDFEMIQLSGSWSRERHRVDRRLHSGIQGITSTRGTSSSQQNPFLALKRTDTNENTGEVYGFNLIYSGNFSAQVEVDQYDTARMTMGINPFDFEWYLKKGESFQTPEVVMVYTNKGLNQMSQIFHDLYKERLVRGKWKNRQRPVLINNWEATYFDFNEDQLVSIAEEANKLGVELFVLDDGWFGRRNDDTTSLGDWHVNTEKLPNGLKNLSRRIRETGLLFGLWFEPEMVSKQSDLYQSNPDWVIHVANRQKSHGRNQYVLDLSRQEVVDYLYEKMANILSEADISYVKWDMNRYMTEIGSATLPVERQSEVAHRYLLGVYQLYERLTSAFPEVLFESCASGGARFDPGMLYYAPQTWTSDNTDGVERLKIQYGTSMVYPLNTMGAHVSDVPNHQVVRNTSLKMRGDVSFFGVFGYELDVTKMSEDEKSYMSKQIAFYKSHRELFQYGDFFRLINPFEKERNQASWMCVSKDKNKAIVGYYRILAEPNPGFKKVTLQGLDPEKRYHIKGRNEMPYGDELMKFGLMLDNEFSGAMKGDSDMMGDFQSALYILEAEN